MSDKKYIIGFSILAFIFILSQCASYKKRNQTPADANSAVLSPAESIKRMVVEDGFEVKLVASEPLISTPVALNFDEKGRIWVVEMTGYMPDTTGNGEEIPSGKIVLLEDRDHNGVMDSRKVIIDSLVMPRAICLIENGLLVAEPPSLWYYPLDGDKPGKRILVDNKYIEGGNVEHSPNGLLRAMDNWIYSAKSAKRYRKSGNQWLVEKTHFRGQWGISQDNFGRLYYNENSTNVQGDYLLPGYGAYNSNQKGVAGFNERVVADNKVYPIHPTPGVNRGYMPGTLDDSLRLVNFTAACAPLVYRGGFLGEAYGFNAFVAEPSANLIKRNILNPLSMVSRGRQAYSKKEFLASTDERFRPVNLHDGPDGSLYIVDMYRGIIQHKTYLTPYLKNEISKRNLTTPLNCGRIYKIVPAKSKAKNVKFPANHIELVKLLANPNGWVRDKAQQLLVDSKDKQVIAPLLEVLHSSNYPLFKMHAFWTLEGLGALQPQEVLDMMKQSFWAMRMQAMGGMLATMNSGNYDQYLPVLDQLIAQNDTLAAPYIAFAANAIKSYDVPAADKLLKSVAVKFPENRYVADAVLSNLQDQEEIFQKEFLSLNPNKNTLLNRQIQKVVTAKLAALANRDPKLLASEFPKGVLLYNTVCQTCHGTDGEGRAMLAPPLNRSQWVTGDKHRLASIVLVGLTGPVEVNGYLYKAPEIVAEMPGIGASKDFTDEDIAQLLSYIRRAWLNNADKVTATEVAASRLKLKDRQKAFTAEELLVQH